MKFAAAHPERTGKIVLNTPGGTMARPEVMERIRSLSQAAADDPSDERIRARLEWLMADPATVTDELVAIRKTIYAQPGFSESMRHILCLQDPEVRRRNLITDAELAAVPHGALVVWTSNDPSGPAAAGNGHGGQDPRRPVRAHHRRRALAAVGTARCVQQAGPAVPQRGAGALTAGLYAHLAVLGSAG